jgi:hypothetical protein
MNILRTSAREQGQIKAQTQKDKPKHKHHPTIK